MAALSFRVRRRTIRTTFLTLLLTQTDALLNVQQTIDAGALLDLTNGRDWVIQQMGSGPNTCGFSKCNWDWELAIEAWGCADPRIGPTG